MPKDQKKTGRQNYDWAKIQHEYVTDPQMTIRKIAAKHGINTQTVAKKSKAEGWFATRKEYQSKVITRAITETGKLQAKELAKEADFLKAMKGHMERMLADDKQFQRHLTTNMVTGETKEEIYNKADTRAMKDAMQTLKLIEEMSRSLYNIQKAQDIQKHQIDADRLKLDQEKQEWEKQKADMLKPDASNSIRIEGLEEGWAE